MKNKSKVVQENIDRWCGLSDNYNSCRPIPPQVIPEIILKYAQPNPQLVVDIGSGTGLSTVLWQNIAAEVTGIEPNDDMRAVARQSIKSDNIVFQKGVSNNTQLPQDSADIVTISQAFHWMDIDSTLDEVYRILKPGGVLAVYDCDWPPCIDWVVEEEYKALNQKSESISYAKENPAVKNDKGSYIKRFNQYGKFCFVKEAICHSIERCTPERMFGITMSQAAIQDALKLDSAMQKDIDAFCDTVNSRLSGTFDIVFSYRLRLAIK